MEFQSYNSELAIANLLFARPFSNIRIGRTDSNGNETQIPVTCVFGQRSRILKSLENPDRRGNMKVPMIVINRTGYSRNGERVNNINNEVKYEITSKDCRLHLMTPIPVDISYDVSVVAKYPSDIDKIASNFMVFFNSDIFVSCEHPKYTGVKLNNQIVMSDSVSEDHSDELDGTQDDLTVATFQFTFKTYLFAGTQKAQLVKRQVLSSTISTFISSDIVVLQPDQIDDFQKQHPDATVSALYSRYVTAEVTSMVDNPNAPTDIYDDIPIVNKIDFGFYVVPEKHDIVQFVQSVDNGYFGEHEHTSRLGYISSEQYISSPPIVTEINHLSCELPHEYEISSFETPLSCVNNYYDIVDWDCSLAPYVDRMYWVIDGGLLCSFPYNVSWERD